MLNAANMYPWYRDSMSQLGQFCAGNNLSSAAATIKTENGYNDCMLALDYAHNKVSLLTFYMFTCCKVDCRREGLFEGDVV